MVLLVYGVNFYYLVYWSGKHKKPALRNHFGRPYVTVQLPIYNEKYVARRIIDAVCDFDYPRHLLQIQVLDDSTDETAEICAQAVRFHQERGVSIEYMRRERREGFKAGALLNGLASANGEFIAIFDADFIPPRSFLQQMIPYFEDESVGLVQAKWRHINRGYSSLTRAEGLSLDAHFLIEQAGRNASHAFINFNGTAGVWRRVCIDDAGGWQECLAEDLDLSFRAQMRNWKCIVVNDVECEAELPLQLLAAKNQQFRWAKGSGQCVRKLLTVLLRIDLPLATKIQAILHLTRHVVFPLALVQYLLLPILMALKFDLAPSSALITFLLLGPLPFAYAMRRMYGREWLGKLYDYLCLVIFGEGVSIVNTKGFLSGLLSGTSGVFERTPKFGIHDYSEPWWRKTYALTHSFMTMTEFGLALYGCVSVLYLVLARQFTLLPVAILPAAGFVYVSYLTAENHLRLRRSKTQSAKLRIVPSPSHIRRRRVASAAGVVLILVGLVLAYNTYVNTVYALDRANAWFNRAETAGFAEDMIQYLERGRALIPNDGNPVWWFPTDKTDFKLIQKDIGSIIERARIIQSLPRSSDAYQQGMDDVRGKIRALQGQVADASGYFFVSISNLAGVAGWVAFALIVYVYGFKTRTVSQLPDFRMDKTRDQLA